MAERIPRLSPDRGHDVQNWLVRVFLPVIFVLAQGESLGVLGFRLPPVTIQMFASIALLTAALFLSETIIIWAAVSVAKDETAIRTVKNWPEKPDWRESLRGPILWTIPEECFFRGYLISQLAAFDLTSALLISTFFFAVLHKDRGRFWILLNLSAGLLFGLAFAWTDSLLPPLVMHAASNNIFPFVPAPWATALAEAEN